MKVLLNNSSRLILQSSIFVIGMLLSLSFFSGLKISAEPIKCTSTSYELESTSDIVTPYGGSNAQIHDTVSNSCNGKNLYEKGCDSSDDSKVCVPESDTSRVCRCTVSPVCVPVACPRAASEGTPVGYIPNNECILQKLMDPSSEIAKNCCENKCNDETLNDDPSTNTETPEVFTKVLSMFGKTISISNENRIATIINLVLTTMLGGSSLYAVVVGIIKAARSANTTDEGELRKINNILLNMLLGVILSWGSIFFIQLVAMLTGIGRLDEAIMVGNTEEKAPTTIVIESGQI